MTPQYAFSGAVRTRTWGIVRASAAAFAEIVSEPSSSPLRSATSSVFSSVMNRTTTCAMDGAPFQYDGFAASSMWSPRTQRTNRYGPVPTASAFSDERASAPRRSRCAGAR